MDFIDNIINVGGFLNGIMNLFSGAVTGGGFLITGVIGLIVLIIAVLLDGVFDFFDLGDGPFSILSVAVFITLFGFLGFVGVAEWGLDPGMAALIGVGAGVLAALGSWQAVKYLRKDTPESKVATLDSMAGKTATVSSPIREGRLGAITLAHQGAITSFAARAVDGTIDAGTSVSIVRMIDTAVALVEPLERK